MNKDWKQKTWQVHKDDYKTKGYRLKKLFEIDLPFWYCKQNLYVEKDIEVDRFSYIILDLVNNGKTKYSEIFKVLGINEDSFVNIQFNYLIKNNFLQEIDNDTLKITHEGINFMNKKTKIKHTEIEDFDFLIPDQFCYLKNDLSGTFFNPELPIDKDWSQGKKGGFSGYSLIQSNKKQKNDDIVDIEHINQPSFKILKEKRSDFAIFYNKMFKGKTFYDFADTKLESHKRNIRFLALNYENEKNKSDFIIDILQYNQSVKKFDFKFYKEEYLSELVTNYFTKNTEKIRETISYIPKNH